MNTKQIIVSVGLAAIWVAAAPAHGLLGGGAGGLGGSMNGMNGRGVMGNGDFNAQDQWGGAQSAVKQLDAKSTTDRAREALTNSGAGLRTRATQSLEDTQSATAGAGEAARQGLDATKEHAESLAHDAPRPLASMAGSSAANASGLAGDIDLQSAGNATASPMKPASAAPSESKPAAGATPKVSSPTAESSASHPTGTRAPSANGQASPSQSVSGSAQQSLQAGSHTATADGALGASHTQGTRAASGSTTGSYH